MTPRVAKRGGSFKGAAAYYLHDKGAATNDRVGFCVTRNLPTEEPELAWRWMAYTAKHTGVLKHDAGGARSGPKQTKPVYTLSLSWHPDDKPTPDLMVAMMDSALKKIGLGRCQSLYVAHNDTEHPHIHALVNLVDPENGKIIDPGRDKDKLSRWAQAYETERGVIRCERRVENNARRDRGERVVDRHSRTRQDYEQEKLIERQILARRGQAKRNQQTRQAADRDALKMRARQEARTIRAQIREKYRPEWARHYQRMRREAQTFRRAEQQALSRMRTLRQAGPLMGVEGRDWIAAILNGFNKARAAAEQQRAAQERELHELRRRMIEERAAAVAAVWADYRRDRSALAGMHGEARRGPAAGATAERAGEPGKRPGPRTTSHYDALKAATPEAPTPDAPARRREELKEEFRRKAKERQTAQRMRLGARRPGDYEALKSVTPETPTLGAPPRDEEARRREQLKAEFRRQAEEIARRRRERKHKDRDRDRER